MVYNLNLKGKVILITGGYGHLGSAITLSLLEHGACVYVLARSKVKFEKAFSDLKEKSLFFEYCDIGDTNSIKNAFKAIYEKEGRINSLINNAFYLKGQSPEKMSDEDFAYGIEGTLNSVFICIREITPFLKKTTTGKIVNVSSMYGVVAPDFRVYDESPQFLNPPHYGAAKAGVIQLTKYYSSFLGRDNITVNAITPGPFPSSAVQEDSDFINHLKNKTALGRVGEPEDLAGAFVFLLSDAANYITGQNIIVDGGWTTT
jgi:NAD(P)-dependent dehydrogenase (short-subunit alcohol dehydrogenase family)